MKQLGYLIKKDLIGEGVVIIKSKEKYGLKLTCKLSDYNFNSSYITIIFNNNDDGFILRDFDIKIDSQIFDVIFFKKKEFYFDLTSDRQFNIEIMKNDLYYDSSLKKIKDKIETIDSVIRLKDKVDILELSENYKVFYYEVGRDKPGDYSRAKIGINTHKPYYLDSYLDKLFPVIKIELGKGEDTSNRPFASDILHYLRINLIGDEKDVDKLETICIEITESIKKLAQLLYNENEHALWIKEEYNKEYRRLLDEHSPKKWY